MYMRAGRVPSNLMTIAAPRCYPDRHRDGRRSRSSRFAGIRVLRALPP